MSKAFKCDRCGGLFADEPTVVPAEAEAPAPLTIGELRLLNWQFGLTLYSYAGPEEICDGCLDQAARDAVMAFESNLRERRESQ